MQVEALLIVVGLAPAIITIGFTLSDHTRALKRIATALERLIELQENKS